MDTKIDDTLLVRGAPETVIIETSAACCETGDILAFKVYLLLPPADAIKFANAILHAAANLPEEDFSDVPAEFLAGDSI
jgi:hypothetical protein